MIKATQRLTMLNLVAVFAIVTAFSSCFFDLELFPNFNTKPPQEDTVVYQGRIVEAYDSDRPVKDVVVKGCTQRFSLFPTWPSCDTVTFTDANGEFYISLKVDDWVGHKISYSKEGYSSLDSCKELNNGTLECYLQPLPTVLSIYAPVKHDVPFMYDSLVVLVQTGIRDTVVHFVTRSFQNSSGGTSYYWSNDVTGSFSLEKTYTAINVLENSNVSVEANYFKNGNHEKLDVVILFCAKGIGKLYKIRDD